MEEKRIKLYQKLKESQFYSKSYNEFINQFFDSSTNCDKLYDACISNGSYSKTKKEWYKSFACDLTWATNTGFCGTVTPPPSPNPAPNPSPAPRPRTDRYTSVTYTGQDVINGETIEKGMKGSIVEKIQEHLNRHGANPVLVVDGKFGDKTKKAVKDFQKSKSLSASGVVEDKTWLELIKDKSSTTTTVTPPKPVKDPLEDIYGTGEDETPVDLFNY
jgi:hypothetical protein